ncbi:MAG: hypothetical protein ACKPKO_24135, partial [Candidatus Fonsibacter sp.]
IVFGSLWDAQLQLNVKAGTLPADALNQRVLAEELSAMDMQHREEQASAQVTLSGPAAQLPTADKRGEDNVDLTVDSIQRDGTRDRVDIRLDALPEERRDIVVSAL